MSNFIDYNDFLRMSEEIEMNKLASAIDMQLILNEKCMKHYDGITGLAKISEFFKMINELQDLKNRAVCHNNHSVADMCEVYIIEIECQMSELRKLYM